VLPIKGFLDIGDQVEQARAYIVFKHVASQLKGCADTAEDKDAGTIRRDERCCDGMHIPLPIAEGEAEATFVKVLASLFDACLDAGPVSFVTKLYLLKDGIALSLRQGT